MLSSLTFLLKEAVEKNDQAMVNYTGNSMYPTLKDSMKLAIRKIQPASIKPADIIAYKQSAIIVVHRVINAVRASAGICFITKGDNQPFGGITEIKEKDLIGRVEGAFYADLPQKNILIKDKYYGLWYVLLGRMYLFYLKYVKSYLPEFLRIFIKNFVAGTYLIFQKFIGPRVIKCPLN